jgi:hypothetical protein
MGVIPGDCRQPASSKKIQVQAHHRLIEPGCMLPVYHDQGSSGSPNEGKQDRRLRAMAPDVSHAS